MKPASPVLHEIHSVTEHVFGTDQPQYLPLPALRSASPDGMVTSRWRASLFERLQILFFGDIWLQQLTYHNKLQPVMLMTDQPDAAECIGESKGL